MRSKKVWTDAFEEIVEGLEDLETLFEFQKEGEVDESEVDGAHNTLNDQLEELELKRMLSEEEDQLNAIMEINPGAGAPRATTGPPY